MAAFFRLTRAGPLVTRLSDWGLLTDEGVSKLLASDEMGRSRPQACLETAKRPRSSASGKTPRRRGRVYHPLARRRPSAPAHPAYAVGKVRAGFGEWPSLGQLLVRGLSVIRISGDLPLDFGFFVVELASAGGAQSPPASAGDRQGNKRSDKLEERYSPEWRRFGRSAFQSLSSTTPRPVAAISTGRPKR